MAVKQVRVHGKKRWQARVAYQGNRLSRLCESKDAAKIAEAELLQELRATSEREAQEGAAPATLALLCEAYVLDLEARGKSPDSITRAKDTAKRLEEFLGPRMQGPLSLTEADFYAYRAHRLRQWAKRGKKAKDGTKALLPGRTKASTINRDFRTLRAMLKRALPGFRFPAGVFLPEDETRVRWLKPEDELLIFATMPAPFGDMARLAAITMMRVTEIRTLRRDQVDLAQGVVTLPRTKTIPRHVVLSAEARGILARALETVKSEYGFPNPDGGPYSRVHVGRVWRKAAKAAGLTDFHFHDLRHHGATMALNAGFTAPIVMALGGWKTERMMRRYAAVTDKTLRAAAEAVSGAEMLRGVGSYAIQR
jgi:integrase